MKKILAAALLLVLTALFAPVIPASTASASTGPIYIHCVRKHTTKHTAFKAGPVKARHTYYVESILFYDKCNPSRGRTWVRLKGLRINLVHRVNECQANWTHGKTAYRQMRVKGYYWDNTGRNFQKNWFSLRCTGDGFDTIYVPYGKRSTTPLLWSDANPRARLNFEAQWDAYRDGSDSVLQYMP